MKYAFERQEDSDVNTEIDFFVYQVESQVFLDGQALNSRTTDYERHHDDVKCQFGQDRMSSRR